MCEYRLAPLPCFWHVFGLGNEVERVKLLQTAGFRYIGLYLWAHRSQHAMLLWQLTNAEHCASYKVTVHNFVFNTRRQKSKKFKKTH